MKQQDMHYSIPSRLNLLIILSCIVFYVGLFYLGLHTQDGWIRILLAFGFGIMMIPVYSLIHEASHSTLHHKPKINLFLGRILCSLFIISFQFYRHCHLKHHKKNRTDEEMWDLYYAHQNKYKRFGNLYLMMIGFGYLAIWLSVILLSLSPQLLRSRLFQRHKEINGFIRGFSSIHKIHIAQLESVFVIVFQLLVLLMIEWEWSLWLTFYLVHGFIWSSQNYVNHAFSPRDIINGAHNLKIPIWLNPIYLNFNVHLAHHQNPQIPWIHLPHFIRRDPSRISFFKNYIRLWKGPRLTDKTNIMKHDEPELVH